MSRAFANGPVDRGSIPVRVIPKTQKKGYLMPPCLTFSIMRYGSRVQWRNPGKGRESYSKPRYSSHSKGSLWATSNAVANFTFLLFILSIIDIEHSPNHTIFGRPHIH